MLENPTIIPVFVINRSVDSPSGVLGVPAEESLPCWSTAAGGGSCCFPIWLID